MSWHALQVSSSARPIFVRRGLPTPSERGNSRSRSWESGRMPDYDSGQYDPPAPVATVSLRPLGAVSPAVDAILLLDTGADITLLPRQAVERLGVRPLEGIDYELIGFDGTRRTAQSVDLDMVFLRKTF